MKSSDSKNSGRKSSGRVISDKKNSNMKTSGMKISGMKRKCLIFMSTFVIALLSACVLVPVLASNKDKEQIQIETEPETEVDYGVWGDDDVVEEILPAETEEEVADVALVTVLSNDQDGFRMTIDDVNALRWETEDNELVVVAKAGSCGRINLYENADASSSRIGEMLSLSAGCVDSLVEDSTGNWYHIVSGDVSGYAREAFFVSGNEAYKLIKASKSDTEAGDVGSMEISLGVASCVTSTVTSTEVETPPETKAQTAGNTATITVSSLDQGLRRQVQENPVPSIKDAGQRGTASAGGYNSNDSSNYNSNDNHGYNIKTGNGHAPSGVKWSSLADASAKRQALVNRGLSYVGGRYVWGGNDPATGADCSGFVRYLYREIGINLPRTSYQQAEVKGRVALADIRPGDLVFYAKNGTVYHVAMYIGDGRIVHAKNTRCGITTDYLSGNEYRAISLLP